MAVRVTSAGLAVVRVAQRAVVEILLGHLGGPFWAKKADGAWSFPKGMVEAGETPVDAAWREFHEETGLVLDAERRSAVDLGTVATSTKIVHLFLVRADPDLSLFQPGHFALEWPPHSGRHQTFPEIDRMQWSTIDDGRRLLSAGQRPFLDRILGLDLASVE